MDWPPLTPDLNPIENLLDELERILCNGLTLTPSTQDLDRKVRTIHRFIETMPTCALIKARCFGSVSVNNEHCLPVGAGAVGHASGAYTLQWPKVSRLCGCPQTFSEFERWHNLHLMETFGSNKKNQPLDDKTLWSRHQREISNQPAKLQEISASCHESVQRVTTVKQSLSHSFVLINKTHG